MRQFSTRIAGCYYYIGHDLSMVTVGDALRLVREPSNIHDANAVRVETIAGTMLGHIPRYEAIQLARDMDSGLAAYAIIDSKEAGRAPVAPVIRGGHLQSGTGIKAIPPTCYITVHVGDGPITLPPRPPSPTVTQHPQPAQPKSSCFVATAVFLDPDHPTVASLRRWRDLRLCRHGAGRFFINAYNLAGPPLSRLVVALPTSRRVLAPLLSIAARMLTFNSPNRRSDH